LVLLFLHTIHFKVAPLSILNAEQRNELFNLLHQAPEMFLDELQDWVALHYDAAITLSALHYIIQDAGLTFKMLHKA
jgi:transposase